MERWAQAHGGWTCVCICVLGGRQSLGLARAMADEMKLAHCVHGFVDRQDWLPTYGQVGCQGFIIFDRDMRLVNRKTSAFLEVREKAFRDVEAIMGPLEATAITGVASTAAEATAGAPFSGCSGSCGVKKAAADSEATGDGVAELRGVAAVNVPSMDAEHTECVARLNDLGRLRSPEALRALLRCLREHFDHEEALFAKFHFGGDGRFSAAESHRQAHAQMLSRLEEALAGAPPDGRLSAAFARSVIADFVEHAEHYDDKYSDHLVAAGAQ